MADADLISPEVGSARQALRTATAQAHAALEALPINRRLFAEDFSGLELADFLGRMVSAYRPLEARLTASLPPGSPDYRRRVPLLLESINLLGGHPPQYEERNFAVPDDEPSRWGVLYVIEGATMGGQMIYRHLACRYPHEVLSFFLPHGDRAGEKWRSFLIGLENALTRPEAIAGACSSAANTFLLFHEALSA